MSQPQVIPEDQWIAAQREFIEGKLELKQLAVKYGVKYFTIRQRAWEQKWGEQRRAYKDKIINAPPAMVAEVLAFAERPLELNGRGLALYQESGGRYLDRVGKIEKMLDEVERDMESADVEERCKLGQLYDRLLERQRIIMQIALPAPVRQREKSAKGVTVAPVDSGPVDGSTSDKV